MSTITRNTVLALCVSLSLIAISSTSAAPPKALLVNPNPGGGGCYELPKFGFSGFNINGFGERVTNVRWGGTAQQMGLESGDVILSLNGYPLTYQGSWNDALREAVYNNGGYVQLKIRDVRTGFIAYRETYVGGNYGPIEHYNYNGPITYKSKTMPHNEHHDHVSGPEQIKQLVDLFSKKNKP